MKVIKWRMAKKKELQQIKTFVAQNANKIRFNSENMKVVKRFILREK